jgi:hypothetical protein
MAGLTAMSALGQKQTSEHDWTMSALPPKADMVQQDGDVRFVPKADISREIALAFSVGAGTVLGANETQVANDFIARPWSDGWLTPSITGTSAKSNGLTSGERYSNRRSRCRSDTPLPFLRFHWCASQAPETTSALALKADVKP